jgi:hypothetical protein
MHIISKLMSAMLAWLNAVDTPEAAGPAAADWADLPTYHPVED